jgi:hypothetical protein
VKAAGPNIKYSWSYIGRKLPLPPREPILSYLPHWLCMICGCIVHRNDPCSPLDVPCECQTFIPNSCEAIGRKVGLGPRAMGFSREWARIKTCESLTRVLPRPFDVADSESARAVHLSCVLSEPHAKKWNQDEKFAFPRSRTWVWLHGYLR